MPLPFILLGLSVIAGGTGVVSGGMGVMKIHDANAIIEKAKNDYDSTKSNLDECEKETTIELDRLGKLKLQIWKDFNRFSSVFEKIKNKPVFTENKEEKYLLEKHELDEINKISINAIGLLGRAALSAGVGSLTGIAVYSGTMALATASTGTAIASLSGVAATNAAMAALGGGSLAAGGGGMALGSTVLSCAVAAPMIAVGGLLWNCKGNSSITKAIKTREQVYENIALIEKSIVYLGDLKKISNILMEELRLTSALYEKQVSIMEYIVNKEQDYNTYSKEEKQIVDNNIMLVKILKKMTQIDLVEKKNDNNVVRCGIVNEEIVNSKAIRERMAA